jgi:serine/threonine protein phosphatase PrpC
MLCPSCHTLNRENARFCKGCGRSFVNDKQPAEATPASVAATAQAAEQPAAPAVPPPAMPDEQTEAAQAAAEQLASAQPQDISLLPTLVLSHEEMMQYHARRYQQEQAPEVEGQHSNNATASEDIAEQPTLLIPPTPTEATSGQPDKYISDVADLPTLITTPHNAPEAANTEHEPAQATSEAHEAIASAEASNTAQTAAAPTEATPAGEPATPEPVASTAETAEAAEAAEQPASDEQQEQAATASEQTTSAFPVLEVGSSLVERYEVLQVLSADEHEHIYQVVDHQGYQRCWNCGSEQNAEGDEFCINCGAELLNVTYTMHEYAPAASRKDTDAHVLLGQIVNTFVVQGRTYLIEQPQIEQPSFPNGVHLMVATDSDAGMLRRGEPNEDSTLVLQLQRVHESLASPVGVFIVADGMGGHDDGQGASRMTINAIADKMVRTLLLEPLEREKAGEPLQELSEDELIATFKSAIQDANTALCQDNQRNKTDKGSTVTGFMIVGDHAYIINVGDSRTYMLRDGKLYQLTNDHSLVGQMVAGGLIEPDDVYTHPQRSQIFRSLGDKLNVQIDDFKQQLHSGDILLSCCDGLWEMVRNPQITDILANAPDPQTACAQLIEAANANGGEDNISAVVVFVRG